jgi:general secretion pathway protein D
MKKIISYFSRFILVSLLVPHYGFAPDKRTITEDSSIQEALSFADTALIDTKIVSEDYLSESKKAEKLQEPTYPTADKATSIQGTLSFADTALIDAKAAPENPLTETKKVEPLQESATIEFNYVNEDITNIINSLATKKGVNVIIPLGAQALATKITLSLPNRITLDEAWAFLQTFLDLSGYSMIPRGDMYYITKKNNAVAKEPLPLYVGMKPSDLPDTDERIRYIYYLSNIKVTEADSELAALLKDLLPQPDSAFKMDPPSNGLIISARSREIKSLMEIIVKLDKIGFLEKFEIFRLRFTNAKDVAELFNNFLLKTDLDPNRYRLDTKHTTDTTYFSKFTRIIPDERTNSLIILGRFQAIERIKEFISQYIDVKIESGKSPIHIYDLEYLKAEEIAPILEKIIQDDLGGGTGQSQAGAAPTGGTQRSFGEVKIMADTPKQAAPVAGQEGSGPSYYGGNNLIIACSNDDWTEIEKLIQSLDQPRSQVLIEVLIANLTLDDIKQLGTNIRNPENLPMPGNMNFQTTNLGSNIPFATEGTSPNKTLKGDLLDRTGITDNLNGTVISFNDNNGKVWGIADIIKNFSSQNILAAPHIIATNNQKATLSRTEIRRLKDQSSGGTGTVSIAYKDESAALNVEIIPRISENNDVNMQIKISINNFREDPNAADASNIPIKLTRELSANTTISNNNILVLGGLVRLDDVDSTVETPLLSKIPLIGWLFKNKQKQLVKTNLTIFIKPIVIKPRLRAGLQKNSQEFLAYASSTAKGSALFGTFKDPVTRLFFATESHGKDLIEDFMHFKQEEIEKTAGGAPTQYVDLTDSESASKKEKRRKKEAHSQKNLPEKQASENEGARADQAEQIFSENETARADMAKKLLQDVKNPLTSQQKESPVQDNPIDKKDAF